MKLFATKSIDALEKQGHLDSKDFIFLLDDKIKDVSVDLVKYVNFVGTVTNVKAITVVDRFEKYSYGFAYTTEDILAFLTNEDEERIKLYHLKEKESKTKIET